MPSKIRAFWTTLSNYQLVQAHGTYILKAISFIIFIKINIQGDHSPWRKPPVDIDLKLHFSIRTVYWNATFTSMSTGRFGQAAWSPCRYTLCTKHSFTIISYADTLRKHSFVASPLLNSWVLALLGIQYAPICRRFKHRNLRKYELRSAYSLQEVVWILSHCSLCVGERGLATSYLKL